MCGISSIILSVTRKKLRYAGVWQGDSPQYGEMSRSDRGNGFPLGILTQSTAKFAEKTCTKRY